MSACVEGAGEHTHTPSGQTHSSPQWLGILATKGFKRSASLRIALGRRKLPCLTFCSFSGSSPHLVTAHFWGTKDQPPCLNLGQFPKLFQFWRCRLCSTYQSVLHLPPPSPPSSLSPRCCSWEEAPGNLHASQSLFPGNLAQDRIILQNRCQRYSSEQNRILMNLKSRSGVGVGRETGTNKNIISQVVITAMKTIKQQGD